MKSVVLDTFLKVWPDTQWTSKLLAKARMKRIASYLIPRQEAEQGENSFEEKRKLVDRYVSMSWKGLGKASDMADHILANASQYRERKDKDAIKTDMLFKRLAYGFEPDEYLCFGLEGKSPTELDEWVSDLDRYRYIFSMNDVKQSQVFNNKSKTYEVFRAYYGRDAVRIKTQADYPAFERFVNEHTEFVKKPVFAGMGRGVELVKRSDISPRAYFDGLVRQGEHIIEERIRQSDVMARLNASSVNTVRCITLNTRGGIVVPYTFLKVGRGGSFVDNGGAGGILAGIDEKMGEVITHGYDEMFTEYTEHPDSGVIFKGYRFPRWNEMKAMCCEMAAMTPSVKCIGWDVALTDQGWIVVEGNGMTQLIVPQIVEQRGIKREFEALMQRMELLV